MERDPGRRTSVLIIYKEHLQVLFFSITLMSVFNASRLLNKTVVVTGASSGIGAVSITIINPFLRSLTLA